MNILPEQLKTPNDFTETLHSIFQPGKPKKQICYELSQLVYHSKEDHMSSTTVIDYLMLAMPCSEGQHVECVAVMTESKEIIILGAIPMTHHSKSVDAFLESISPYLSVFQFIHNPPNEDCSPHQYLA